jgi:hypothetical protein
MFLRNRMLQLYVEDYENKTNWIHSIIQHMTYEETTIEDCDYIISSIIPYGCTSPSFIQQALLSYENNKKRVIVFLLSDYNEPLHIPKNVLLFRSGMYRSQRKPNEYLIPYVWVQLGIQDTTPLFKKGTKPVIGFCGSIASHPCRVQHLNQIKRQPDMKTNFIIRTNYWAGKPHDPEVIQQFIKNVRDTYFTVCSRGAGNWSARFYEVLSLGRIPIVVDTDMVLPLEDKINWRDIIVLCDTENDIPNAIRTFWNQKDMVQAQQRCKQIYEEFLSPTKWCSFLIEDLEKLKNESIRNATGSPEAADAIVPIKSSTDSTDGSN